MIPSVRQEFNARYKPEKYPELLRRLEQRCGVPIEFRVSETPVFLPVYLVVVPAAALLVARLRERLRANNETFRGEVEQLSSRVVEMTALTWPDGRLAGVPCFGHTALSSFLRIVTPEVAKSLSWNSISSLPRWVRLSHSILSNKPRQAQQITRELPP